MTWIIETSFMFLIAFLLQSSVTYAISLKVNQKKCVIIAQATYYTDVVNMNITAGKFVKKKFKNHLAPNAFEIF